MFNNLFTVLVKNPNYIDPDFKYGIYAIKSKGVKTFHTYCFLTYCFL